jgi:hypothetical protein
VIESPGGGRVVLNHVDILTLIDGLIEKAASQSLHIDSLEGALSCLGFELILVFVSSSFSSTLLVICPLLVIPS